MYSGSFTIKISYIQYFWMTKFNIVSLSIWGWLVPKRIRHKKSRILWTIFCNVIMIRDIPTICPKLGSPNIRKCRNNFDDAMSRNRYTIPSLSYRSEQIIAVAFLHFFLCIHVHAVSMNGVENSYRRWLVCLLEWPLMITEKVESTRHPKARLFHLTSFIQRLGWIDVRTVVSDGTHTVPIKF